MTVCTRCNDTHAVESEEHGSRMCLYCPVPCQRCRAGGTGPYCGSTPCPCACHAKPAAPEPAPHMVANRPDVMRAPWHWQGSTLLSADDAIVLTPDIEEHRACLVTCGTDGVLRPMFRPAPAPVACLIAAAAELRDALADLVDPHQGPCRLDHNGFCQEHLSGAPCVVATGRAALAKARGAPCA